MEPLRQAPAVIPQLIMSMCAVSIMTYNKLSEITTPFYGGNKIRPRINITTGTNTFNWLFNTDAAITCMNADSLREAIGHSRPKLLKKSARCIAANDSRMTSLGIFEIEMTIRGRKFSHPAIVVEDINDNILGIDFMHAHKLNYDPTSKQITFAHMLTNTLYSVKEVTIPALSSMMVNTKFKGLICDTAQPIATVHAPQHPTISGMPAWVNLDNYKNCKIIIDNCAAYDISDTQERNCTKS
jgi:hypothetical protein